MDIGFVPPLLPPVNQKMAPTNWYWFVTGTLSLVHWLHSYIYTTQQRVVATYLQYKCEAPAKGELPLPQHRYRSAPSTVHISQHRESARSRGRHFLPLAPRHGVVVITPWRSNRVGPRCKPKIRRFISRNIHFVLGNPCCL